MNERYRLNKEFIRAQLRKDGRKLSYLANALNVSGSLVAQMLGKPARVPGEETLKALAELFGVTEQQLLLPRKSEAKKTA